MICLEKWNVINDLEISNSGDVKSNGKLLKGEITKNGYRRINISRNGTTNKYLVHRLVAQAFIPNPDNKPCVNHIDGDKLNNCVDNLEWVTYSENEIHSIKVLHKETLKGERNPIHKLTDEDVMEIRKLYVKGKHNSMNSFELARKYNVTPKAIQNIVRNKSWKHLL